MKARPFQGWIAAMCLALLVVSGRAWAVPAPPLVKPSQTARNPPSPDADAAPPTTRPLAAVTSPLDSEPIRRTGDSSSTALNLAPPQTIGLPRVAGSLVIVITLILLLRWGARKLFNAGPTGKNTRAIQILARSPVTPKQHIVLLRVGRRIIVVGDSGVRMTPLSEITDADEVASLLGQLQDEKTRLPTKAFAAMFSRARGETDEPQEHLPSTDGRLSGAGDESADADNGDEVHEPDAEAHDSDVSITRNELTGLADKIRVMSKHFRGGPA